MQPRTIRARAAGGGGLLKLGVGAAALAPAALTTLRFLTDRLGANPIAEAMNQLGLWTLIAAAGDAGLHPAEDPVRLDLAAGGAAAAGAGVRSSTSACTSLTYLVLDQFFDLAAIWRGHL